MKFQPATTMADLSDYDPYVDHELNHYRHTSDVDTGLLSPGLNAEKAEGNSHFAILFAQSKQFSHQLNM